MPKVKKTRTKYYMPVLATAFLLGTLPAVMNVTVDPYQLFWPKERSNKLNDMVEKTHYPLWKLAKFDRGAHDTIILGDSRARALRDKYWKELDISGALNLAYGGGTIPEIYSTFKEIKTDPAIKNLVIGVQLRSFSEAHKRGMNRVPEAIHLVRNKFEYLKNWGVFQTTLKVFEKENEDIINQYGSLISSAHAAGLGDAGSTSLSKLLEPKICYGCDVPTKLKPIVSRPKNKSYALPNHYSYGSWSSHIPYFNWNNFQALYHAEDTYEVLPKIFEQQIQKNAKSDWRGFQFSKKYWSYFQEMGAWAKDENKNLVFVIPPTITKMQNTIQENGLGKTNHLLRLKLAELGTVVDFDFPNPLTQDYGRFNDAYHFNARLARQIIGQLVPKISNDQDAIDKALKHEQDLSCEVHANTSKQRVTQEVQMIESMNCRIWSSLL